METDRAPLARQTSGLTGRPVLALAASCHPGPSAAVTVLVTVLAVAAGHSAGGCAWLAAAVLTGQLSVGWCNDAFDARRDAAAGRPKPVATGAVSPQTVWAAAHTALALCVPLSLMCGSLAGTVHLAGVGAAWAYNLRLKATMWSWLPYAAGFASLPAFVTLSSGAHSWPPWWVVVAGALLGVGAHLADTVPDISSDLAVGVRGLPHRLGTSGTRRVLPVPLVAATVALALGPPGPLPAAGAVALTAAVATALAGAALGRTHTKAPFAAAVAVATVDVALLLAQGSRIT
ncbi:prenyltransferase [Streptomyces netropsis]|uniref:4-hydroxybenzoate polyprenyltransferase n=1 Tax=Streptomyces syringium TaxID=76729 RepID=A0ABS4YE51_9ACTN|nr:4-hydroxybenzoate polyprenyltransferase [Streptomyces syringium]SPE62149.1 prenyltransferase [Streptomyces netropsis]